MVFTVNCNLVAAIENVFFDLINREATLGLTAKNITAIDIEGSLHSVLIENLGETDIGFNSIVVAKGYSLKFALGDTKKSIFHN